MDSSQEIGVACLDANGRELGSIGGAAKVVSAESEAWNGLQQIYPNAAKAVIYSGRSYLEGEELKVITR